MEKNFFKVSEYFNQLTEEITNTDLYFVSLLLDQHYKEYDNSGRFLFALNKALLKYSPPPEIPGSGEDNQINRAYTWIDNKYKQRAKEAFKNNNADLLTSAKKESKKEIHKTLPDIWLGSKKDFNNVIKIHLKEYVSSNGDNLTWKTGRGQISYMAGLYKILLMHNRLRTKNLSATSIKKIFENTFSVQIKSSTPFKAESLVGLNPKFFSPFQGIPVYTTPIKTK